MLVLVLSFLLGVIWGVEVGAPEAELDLFTPHGEAMNVDLEELASMSSLGVPIEATDLARQMFAGDLLPEPYALFPLVGEDVNSIDGIYRGFPNTVQWIQDDRFGIVPYCDQNNVDHVITLESVPYYIGGELAVNFWFKAHNVTGEHFQYLFSHSSIQFQQAQLNLNQGVLAAWSPNQLNVYMPEFDHFSHGIMRAVLKDANDVYLGRRSQTYVDSDGQVGINTGERLDSIDVGDGRWHMATVTTRADGRLGYQLYIDGFLSGEMEEGDRYIGPGGDVLDINGGDAILLDGNITICGRSDRHPERDFEGSIAYVSLFDTSLTQEQVQYMFEVAGGADKSDEKDLPKTRPDRNTTAPGAAPGVAVQPEITFGPGTISGENCTFPYEYEGLIYNECIEVNEVLKCKTTSNEMVQCVANVVIPDSTPLPPEHPNRHDGRVTVSGQECFFPSVDGRTLVYDCVERDGVESCQNQLGVWEECILKDASATVTPSSVTPSTSIGLPSSSLLGAPPSPIPLFSLSPEQPNTGVLPSTAGFSYIPLDQDILPSPDFPVFTMPTLGGESSYSTGYGQQPEDTQQMGNPVQPLNPAPTPTSTTPVTNSYTNSFVPAPTQVNNPYGTAQGPAQFNNPYGMGVQQTPPTGAALQTGATDPTQQTTATLADVFGGPPSGLYPPSYVNPGLSTPAGNPLYAPGPAPGQIGTSLTGYTTGNPTGGLP